ncbi:MAG: FHA domain-containing protein [Myxococcaceae bacterium]
MLPPPVELPAVAPFTEYVRRFIDDEQALAQAVDTPVLVWEAGLFAEDWSHPPSQVPTADNPVVFLLRKTDARPNPYEAGISLGRASVNDVVLPHKSISRFHAYFQKESSSARWAVADAASRNGTQADGQPLQPNVPALLGGAHRLRVGDLDLTFLSPEAFVRWLKKVVETV